MDRPTRPQKPKNGHKKGNLCAKSSGDKVVISDYESDYESEMKQYVCDLYDYIAERKTREIKMALETIRTLEIKLNTIFNSGQHLDDNYHLDFERVADEIDYDY